MVATVRVVEFESRDALPFQLTICCSKKPMKRLPIMFCSATSLSSSASYVSPGCNRMLTPVVLKGLYSSLRPAHVFWIFCSWMSILISARPGQRQELG